MKGKVYIILLAVAYFQLIKTSHAQDINYKSYSLFVYNFIKYTEWPATSSTDDFVIGVIGDSPIMKELELMASTKKVKGKQTLIIKKVGLPEESVNCNLLYISSAKSSLLKVLLEKTKAHPVLIVAEREGLAKKGAAINFITMDDDALKFEINKEAIESHNLKVTNTLVYLGLPVK